MARREALPKAQTLEQAGRIFTLTSLDAWLSSNSGAEYMVRDTTKDGDARFTCTLVHLDRTLASSGPKAITAIDRALGQWRYDC